MVYPAENPGIRGKVCCRTPDRREYLVGNIEKNKIHTVQRP